MSYLTFASSTYVDLRSGRMQTIVCRVGHYSFAKEPLIVECVSLSKLKNQRSGKGYMENVVGINILDNKRGPTGFITWGRLFDRIDDTELLECIKKAAPTYGIHTIESIELCWSLQEVSHYPYFYEAFLMVAQKGPIPFGEGYAKWVRKMRKALRNGDEIYFLGFLNRKAEVLAEQEKERLEKEAKKKNKKSTKSS